MFGNDGWKEGEESQSWKLVPMCTAFFHTHTPTCRFLLSFLEFFFPRVSSKEKYLRTEHRYQGSSSVPFYFLRFRVFSLFARSQVPC